MPSSSSRCRLTGSWLPLVLTLCATGVSLGCAGIDERSREEPEEFPDEGAADSNASAVDEGPLPWATPVAVDLVPNRAHLFSFDLAGDAEVHFETGRTVGSQGDVETLVEVFRGNSAIKSKRIDWNYGREGLELSLGQGHYRVRVRAAYGSDRGLFELEGTCKGACGGASGTRLGEASSAIPMIANGSDFFQIAGGPSGSVFVAGDFSSQVELGATTLSARDEDVNTAFVARLDESGAALWTSRITGPGSTKTVVQIEGDERGVSFAANISGGSSVVIRPGKGANRTVRMPTTTSGQPTLIARFAADGSLLFADAVAANVNSIGTQSDGSVVIGGECTGTCKFGSDSLSSGRFVAAYSRMGQRGWICAPGEGEGITVERLSVAADDSIFIAGSLTTSAVFGQSEVSAAGFGTAGRPRATGYVAKLDRHGQARSGVFVPLLRIEALEANAGGGALVAGLAFPFGDSNSAEGLDEGGGTLISVTGEGGIAWAHDFGDIQASGPGAEILGIEAVGSTAYIVGRARGSIDLAGSTIRTDSEDAFVALYDSSGTALWARTFGAEGTEVAQSVCASGRTVFVEGIYQGSTQIDGLELGGMGWMSFLSAFPMN